MIASCNVKLNRFSHLKRFPVARAPGWGSLACSHCSDADAVLKAMALGTLGGLRGLTLWVEQNMVRPAGRATRHEGKQLMYQLAAW